MASSVWREHRIAPFPMSPKTTTRRYYMISGEDKNMNYGYQGILMYIGEYQGILMNIAGYINEYESYMNRYKKRLIDIDGF